jgi:hypothetical protein
VTVRAYCSPIGMLILVPIMSATPPAASESSGVGSPGAVGMGAHEPAFAGYRSSLAVSRLAPSTRARYAARVRAYLTWLSGSGMPEPIASHQAADAFLAYLRSAGKSPAVCAGYRAALNDFRTRYEAGPASAPAGSDAPSEGADVPASGQSRDNWLRRITRPALKALQGFPGLLATTVITTVIAAAVSLGLKIVLTRPVPPVTVAVQDNPGQIPGLTANGQEGVIPAGAHVTGSPGDGCSGFAPWLKANGGIPGETQVQLVVQSDTSAPVLISDMRIHVLRRSAPVVGTSVACSSAGYSQIRMINVNLNTTPPLVTYESAGRNLPFGFTLQDGETEVFDIVAADTRSYCSYELVLDLVIGGKSRSIVVGDKGHPFQVMPLQRDDTTWEWNYNNAWSDPDGHSISAGSQFPKESS